MTLKKFDDGTGKALPEGDASLDGAEYAVTYRYAGESKTVTFDIPDSALSFFDADAHKWTVEPGEFIAHVGSASDDIRTSVRFNVR